VTEYIKPGDLFGRWTSVGRSSRKCDKVDCVCRCGTERGVLSFDLLEGKTLSCGCLQAEMLSDRVLTHGMSKTLIYGRWNSMVMRCHNKNSKSYSRYGARGVSVCDRWRLFDNFFSDMGEPPTRRHTLERENSNGNYEPGNVVWATYRAQSLNTRRNNYITAFGRTLCINDWSKLLNRSRCAIKYWLKRGSTNEEALTGSLSRRASGGELKVLDVMEGGL
jgi:hypothetical protein